MEPLVLESCHSTWLFDTERMRFRRVLKGLDVENHPASTGWRPYFGLDVDPVSESFVVLLNPEGTRLLRSWRHVDHCTQCGGILLLRLSREQWEAVFGEKPSFRLSKKILDALEGLGVQSLTAEDEIAAASEEVERVGVKADKFHWEPSDDEGEDEDEE